MFLYYKYVGSEKNVFLLLEIILEEVLGVIFFYI